MIWLILAAAFIIGFSAFIIWRVFVREGALDRWRAVFVYRIWPRCEHCKSLVGLRLEDGRTCYPHDAKPWDDSYDAAKDPNRSQLLCRFCAVMHHDYWDDMWKDYYSGRI